jgi:hypothetical protein
MPESCTHCRPWDDGACDFGCPCRDCDEGRKYEAFVTNPNRETPSTAECAAYLAWLRGGETWAFRFGRRRRRRARAILRARK